MTYILHRRFRQPLKFGSASYAGAVLLLLLITLPFTRDFSGINLVISSAFCFLYLLLAKKIHVIPRSLLLLSALSVLYALLSVLDVFPPAWTQRFEISAIPQQALFSYAIPTTMGVLIVYLRKHLASPGGRRAVAKKLLLVWLAWKLLGVTLNPAGATLAGFLSISQMGNASSLIIVATCLYLSMLTSSLKKYFTLVLFCVLSALSPFSQNLAYALAFSLVWIFPRQAKMITLGFILSSVLLYLLFYNDPFAVRFIDANLTVRLILIRDAVAGLVQSYFMGVGFGTESITNDYARFGLDHFQSEEDIVFIHLAVHNSFFTIGFRLGLAGLMILLYFLVQTFRKIDASPTESDAQAQYALFLAFFVVTFTNPALESFGYMYGVCLYLASIWAHPQGRANAILLKKNKMSEINNSGSSLKKCIC